jgi:hypothetical protein
MLVYVNCMGGGGGPRLAKGRLPSDLPQQGVGDGQPEVGTHFVMEAILELANRYGIL